MSNPFRIIPLGGENMIAVPQGFGGVVDVTLDDGRRYRITVAAKTGEYEVSEEFGKWDVRRSLFRKLHDTVPGDGWEP